MDIEIVKAPPQYPNERTKIVVDGVPWAKLERRHHSRYGTSYTLHPITGGPDIEWKLPDGTTRCKIKSSSKNADHAPSTLHTRIKQAVEMAIAQGKLKHPDVIRKQRSDREAERERQHQEAQRRTIERRRKRVIDIFAKHGFEYGPTWHPVIDDIVDAIEGIANE